MTRRQKAGSIYLLIGCFIVLGIRSVGLKKICRNYLTPKYLDGKVCVYAFDNYHPDKAFRVIDWFTESPFVYMHSGCCGGPFASVSLVKIRAPRERPIQVHLAIEPPPKLKPIVKLRAVDLPELEDITIVSQKYSPSIVGDSLRLEGAIIKEGTATSGAAHFEHSSTETQADAF